MSIQNDDIRPDYTIHLSASVLAESGTEGGDFVTEPLNGRPGFAPFRMYTFGPFNLRGQTTTSYYRTFLGKQKT